VEFNITPFDFLKFLSAKNKKLSKNPIFLSKELKILLNEYLLYGGLPDVVLENNINLKKNF